MFKEEKISCDDCGCHISKKDKIQKVRYIYSNSCFYYCGKCKKPYDYYYGDEDYRKGYIQITGILIAVDENGKIMKNQSSLRDNGIKAWGVLKRLGFK